MLAIGSVGWLGDVAKIPSCGIDTAELRPLGHGITAGRGMVVVVVGTVVVVVLPEGTVVVVVEPEGTVVDVVVVLAGTVVVVVVAALGLDENAPAGSTTMSDTESTPVSEKSNAPRRLFHKALTASWYWRG